jgi:excinuclease UvrABC helicase subunit UvrB
VILLNVCPSSFDSREHALSSILHQTNRKGLSIYTSNHKIKTEEWSIVSHENVSAEEKQMSKRIVAGNIWIEDDFIGIATENDYESLAGMGVCGIRAAEKKIGKYLFN